MEREANYAAVGIFVLLMVVMGVLFVYWYSDNRDHRNFVRYEIYFDGTVSGLSEGGPVRYLGVDVGRVQRIRIDPRAANRVQVVAGDRCPHADLRPDAGAAVIAGGDRTALYRSGAGARQRPWPAHPCHGAERELPGDTLGAFRSGPVPEQSAELDRAPERPGRPRLARAVRRQYPVRGPHRRQSSISASSGFPRTAHNIDTLVDTLNEDTQDARRLINDLHASTQTASVDFLAAMQKLRATSDNLMSASSTLDSVATRNRDQINSFVSQGLPQVEALLRDSRGGRTADQRTLARPAREPLAPDLSADRQRRDHTAVRTRMRMAPVTMVLMGLAVPALTGCFSGLSSKLPAQQRYVLQPTFAAPAAPVTARAGSVEVLRPSAAAGLGGDGIAVLRPGERLDYYTNARWAGDAPSTLQSLVIESLRDAGRFATRGIRFRSVRIAVHPGPGTRALRGPDLRGDGPPSIEVTLVCSPGPAQRSHRHCQLLPRAAQRRRMPIACRL